MNEKIEKPTLALVTTFDEFCGIAHYALFLKKQLDKHFDVDVIKTPRSVFMQSTDTSEIRAADIYAEKLGQKIAKYDFVNIQYEPGILGHDMQSSTRRFIKILRKAKKLTVTFHYVARRRKKPWQFYASMVFRLKFLSALREYRNDRAAFNLWEKLFVWLRKKARKNELSVITHTLRDQNLVRALLPGTHVGVTPLTYMDNDYLNSISELVTKSSLLPYFRTYPLPETRFIGLFGFFQPYKGFETALRAMAHLPENYELLFFSSVHESTLSIDRAGDDYLNSLLALIQERDREIKSQFKKANGPNKNAKRRLLSTRVHFLGAQSDDDMLIGMKLCDAILFPYINSVHTASGPLAQAVELNRVVLASRNIQFVEYEKLQPGCINLVDVGNDIEIASKVLALTEERRDVNVGGLRFVENPKRNLSITINESKEVYLRAMEAS